MLTAQLPAAASHAAVEFPGDGRRVVIRALRPEDRAGVVAAFNRVSTQSVYRRFFAVKRHFSDAEVSFLLNPDFTNHVALVATTYEDGVQAIIGAGRYVVTAPGRAEVAFMVIDAYQGQHIGSTLLAHLIAVAREAGLDTLTAEVLSENAAMLKVFEHCGLPMRTRREAEVVHVALTLAPVRPGRPAPPAGPAAAH